VTHGLRVDVGRLGRIGELFARNVDDGVISGGAAIVDHAGERVYREAVGWRDVEARDPLRPDALFRIASMSKPITVACAMTFVDDGSLRLDDPVDRWLPELADRPVLRRPSADLDDTLPMERPITLRDLCTHRSGYISHGGVPGPLGAAMAGMGGLSSHDADPDAWIAQLGELPLIDQPGARFTYGISHDILGVLLARVGGKRFSEVLRERIFDPLEMRETAFHAIDQRRLAVAYRPGSDGALVADEAANSERWHRSPRFESGAGGMVSTLDDYRRFGAMLLRHGSLEGTRVLSPAAVALMRTDHLTPFQREKTRFRGTRRFFDFRGYGLGVSIVDDLTCAPALSSVGAFGWGGYYGTWWHSFPGEDVVAVMAIQVLDAEENLPVAMDFQTAVMAAIIG
jgi:CubicO group peptidase (beta-lactamase class C family)